MYKDLKSGKPRKGARYKAVRPNDGTKTAAQHKALEWLKAHGGDGLFDKRGRLVARGESAPHTQAMWKALATSGLVEFYYAPGKRLRVTKRN